MDSIEILWNFLPNLIFYLVTGTPASDQQALLQVQYLCSQQSYCYWNLKGQEGFCCCPEEKNQGCKFAELYAAHPSFILIPHFSCSSNLSNPWFVCQWSLELATAWPSCATSWPRVTTARIADRPRWRKPLPSSGHRRSEFPRRLRQQRKIKSCP